MSERRAARSGDRNTDHPAERRADRRDDLKRLYDSHYDALYTYFVRRTAGSHGDAAELTAEVFVVAWRHLADIPPAPSDRLWLYGAARRVLSTYRRSRQRWLHLAEHLEAVYRVAPQTPVDGFDRLRDAIEHLPRRDREIVKLVYWEHLSHIDAAAVVGCTPSAAASRLRRARDRIGRTMEQDPRSPPPQGKPPA